jgi:hypothetical protein
MKGEALLQLVDRFEVPALTCRRELLESRVRAGDVSRVMLAMMQLERPRGVVRLQRGVPRPADKLLICQPLDEPILRPCRRVE